MGVGVIENWREREERIKEGMEWDGERQGHKTGENEERREDGRNSV